MPKTLNLTGYGGTDASPFGQPRPRQKEGVKSVMARIGLDSSSQKRPAT